MQWSLSSLGAVAQGTHRHIPSTLLSETPWDRAEYNTSNLCWIHRQDMDVKGPAMSCVRVNQVTELHNKQGKVDLKNPSQTYQYPPSSSQRHANFMTAARSTHTFTMISCHLDKHFNL